MTGRQTGRQTDRQAGGQTYRLVDVHTGRWMGRQADMYGFLLQAVRKISEIQIMTRGTWIQTQISMNNLSKREIGWLQ